MGIEVKGGAMANIIPRNSPIPIREEKPFTTTEDDQDVVTIRIFEGERPMTKDNHFLGEFDLTGIPLAPRGVPQIDVTFDIDVNGILNVSVGYG
jgi:heat shock protein 5